MAPTLLIVLALVAIAWPMAGPLHARWRRARLARLPFPPAWRTILRRRVPLLQRLPAELRLQLQRRIRQFVAEVPFIGCAGQEITDEVRVTIAAQACLLLLNRGDAGFEGLREVLVYPGAFAVDRVQTEAGGVQRDERRALSGESHGRGAVVLSWLDTLAGAAVPDDGHNVVIHEFAHRLDQDHGNANGAPWLGPKRDYGEWSRVLGAEYAALCARVRAGEEGLISAYGATDPAEFFAVVSELYFERPDALRREHPALYAQIGQVYRTDPTAW